MSNGPLTAAQRREHGGGQPAGATRSILRKRISKESVDAAKPSSRRVFLWDTKLTGFGLKVMPSGKKIYIFQYRPRGLGRKGAPKRLTIGRHGDLTAEKARRIADNLVFAARAGQDPAAVLRGSTGPGPTVSDLVERFLQEFLPSKKRPPRASTMAYYEAVLRCHVLPRLGRKRVADLTADDIEALHAALRDRPYAANRTVTVFRHALDQAERWSWRPQHTNPAARIDRYREERRGAKKEVMLTPQEMRRLLDAIDAQEEAGADPRACAAIRFAFWTGWRIGEVLRLEWANLDLEHGSARLLQTKAADEEYRQLPSEAIAILERQPRVAGCSYVFPGRDLQGHLTTVKGPWRRIRRVAGLDDMDGLGAFRLHDLRHNVVSWDVSRGVPLEIAGKNVGHRSRGATEVYAHFAPSALKRAADERAAAMRAAVEEATGLR